jgi:hypothetical protein
MDRLAWALNLGSFFTVSQFSNFTIRSRRQTAVFMSHRPRTACARCDWPRAESATTGGRVDVRSVSGSPWSDRGRTVCPVLREARAIRADDGGIDVFKRFDELDALHVPGGLTYNATRSDDTTQQHHCLTLISSPHGAVRNARKPQAQMQVGP